LLFPVLFLVGVGIVMVYSASSALALNRFGSDYYFLKKQAVFALLGTIVMVIGRHFPYRYLRSLAYPLVFTAVASLAAIHISGLGYGAGGSMRWLRIGGLSFQPSEFARIALIVYLAYSMDKKGEQLKEFSVGFLPHILVLAVFTGLMFLQPDFGSVVIFTALTWIMLFVGGVRLRHLLSALVPLLPLAYLLMINAESLESLDANLDT
jgi:cell division protein FtsW